MYCMQDVRNLQLKKKKKEIEIKECYNFVIYPEISILL